MNRQGFVAPLAFWTHAVNAAEIELAVRAYERGDFSSARVSFHTLADKGNCRAQHYLGEMYCHGQGVPKQLETALKWYEAAAASGHRAAQTQLDLLYARDDTGVSRDYVKAHAWLSMAADNGDSNAAVQRDITAQAMQSDELEQAKALYERFTTG